MSDQRIAPGRREDVGYFAWALSRAGGRLSGTEPMKLFLTLGRHPRLFRGWLKFAGRMMPRGTLPRRETELVILRVAHLTGCGYEREHHERIGRRAKLTPEEIARTKDEDVAAGGWSPRERAVLQAVDALHTARDLDESQWADLRRHLNDPETIELLLLAGHYEMLATVIGTLRIEPDRPRR